MCGIVACSGEDSSQKIIIDALARMQYRGYDSYGFAFVGSDGGLETCKSTETFDSNLVSLPDSPVFLGHTRWATHGVVNLQNSHPHVDPLGRFALVHNGIVDNFSSLKDSLVEKGTRFVTSTDTEVIVHLMSEAIDIGKDRFSALESVQEQIEGRNTLVFLFGDGELLGMCQGSPLVLCKGESGIYLASDILAFANQTRQCMALEDGQVISILGQKIKLVTKTGESKQPGWHKVDLSLVDEGKEGYNHYMLKEIQEQWRTIPVQIDVDEHMIAELAAAVRSSNQVLLTGSGGAYYAAKQIAWLLRARAGVKAVDVPAYELVNWSGFADEGDLMIAVSQSGETADTLEAINIARTWGLRVASLVNMPMSTMTRISDLVFYNSVGPEECVLSTKSASAQITFGYVLASYLQDEFREARRHLDMVSHLLSEEMGGGNDREYRNAARYLHTQPHLFILGRGEHYGSALIGALNIKEASYLHAEAFSAGELKHGVIALIEPGTPVIIFMPEADSYMHGVAAEVKSRGAYVVALTNDAFDQRTGRSLIDVKLPLPADGSIVSAIIPCQLLAYYIAIEKGLNPDRPRNLAKSVTVQ